MPRAALNELHTVLRGRGQHRSAVLCSSPMVGLTTGAGTREKTLGINDFYLGGDDGWPLGNIQMVGKSNGWAMKGEEPKLTMLAPHWSLDDVAHHAVDFWLTTEDLPDPDNRVTVDREGHVHLAYTSNNDEEADRLYHELKKVLNHIGMAEHHVLGKTST